MQHPKKFSAWGVIYKGDQCLFIQRSAKSSRPNQWCPPGGGNEQDETPAQTCQREVKEEVGLDVTVGELLLEDSGFYYFSCQMKDPNQPVKLQQKECSDHQWIEPKNLLNLGFIMELRKMKRLFSNHS